MSGTSLARPRCSAVALCQSTDLYIAMATSAWQNSL